MVSASNSFYPATTITVIIPLARFHCRLDSNHFYHIFNFQKITDFCYSKMIKLHSHFCLSASSHWTRAMMWSVGCSRVLLSGVPSTTRSWKYRNMERSKICIRKGGIKKDLRRLTIPRESMHKNKGVCGCSPYGDGNCPKSTLTPT